MDFSPIRASADITEKYKRYLRTIFSIDDEEYSRQLDEELSKPGILAKGPYLDAVDTFKKGKSLHDLIESGLVPHALSKLNFPLDRSMYLHQQRSIEKCRQGNNVVVSTGTGSGKTESFLMPVLAELAAEDEAGTLCPGIRALLIYPMNALANDQMDRLRELLVSYPKISFGSYTGQTKETDEDALRTYLALNKGRQPLSNELISRESMRATPPNILITNYAMLEFLMVRPRESSFFSGQYARFWKFIILDEAHVYKGSTGIEVSMLLRRVRSSLSIDSLQYILTSATLGSENQNQEVADFATRLCSSIFTSDNIIRAERKTPDRSELGETERKLSEYHDLAEAIRKNNNGRIASCLKEMGQSEVHSDDDLHDAAYEVILKDGNYWRLREILKDNPRTVEYIAEEFGCDKEEIVDFVTAAAFGIRQGGQLLDAKYHMFLRATDSAFITLAPSKKLMLTRQKKIIDGGEEYTVFEMAICRFCHSIYLVGALDDNGFFVQTGTELTNGKKAVIYLGDELSDDIDAAKEKIQRIRICPHCGKVIPWKAGAIDCCEHDPSQYVSGYLLFQEVSSVTTCVACGNRNGVGGVLRQLFTGQEAATSVIGTALFEALPSQTVVHETVHTNSDFDFDFDEEPESTKTVVENAAKQFIAFSDSRQAAAYFASYFGETYEGILYKRLIVETLKREDFDDTLIHFAGVLQGYFEKYKIIDENDTDKMYQHEAWKAILAEMVGLTSANSLQNLGFLSFDVDESLVGGSQKYGLSREDVAGIIDVFLTTMMIDAAIKYPVTLNSAEKEFFTYNGHEGEFLLSDSSQSKSTSSFLPTKAGGKNHRLDYLMRVIQVTAPDKSREDVLHFLESIWNLMVDERKQILQLDGKGYKVNAEKINVRTHKRFYRCPVCRKITPYNVHGVCPSYKCKGILVEAHPDEELKDNHYYRLFNEMEIRKLRVVEHTAQLSREKAYDYQNRFKEKKIDVLSCSTTFELGVDVGSLETVFMRNMPPSPANYAQRAGRAGRSLKSVAYAITFCNKANHDFSYFSAPESMIRGRINPPVFKIENDKIAIRHVFASAFAFFWKKHPEYFRSIGKFAEKDEDGEVGVDIFENYLAGRPENLKAFLKDFLPLELSERFSVDDFGWVELMTGPEGVFTKAISSYRDEIKKLNLSLKEAQEGKGGNIYFIQDRIRTFQNEDIITFLSRKNVLPQYGFPVDTVELSIYDIGKKKNGGSKLQLDLQRDLGMAISEYAPGSQIVADGNLITSRYIRKIPNMAWKMYDYSICEGCKTLNVEQHIDYEAPDHLKTCRACGAELEGGIRTFIVPEFGFEANEVRKASLIKPKRTYNSEVAFVGANDDIKVETYSTGRHKYEMIFGQNDEMAVLNQSSFFVCEECGYTEVDFKQPGRIKTKAHHQSSGRMCSNNKLKKYSLGYRFQTDVMQIRFCSPELEPFEEALSVLYGLIRGTCSYLNIEQSDIAGCLQYFENEDTRHGCYSIILYDSTPGGAGHVKRLNDQNVFENVLRETFRIVDGCTCGGEKKDTSCYSCLRTYANQRFHNLLQRRYVLDFLNKFFED